MHSDSVFFQLTSAMLKRLTAPEIFLPANTEEVTVSEFCIEHNQGAEGKRCRGKGKNQ